MYTYSMYKYTNSLFIFRQDLRIHDNRWRNKVLELSNNILPIFIFDTSVLSHFSQWDKRLWFVFSAVQNLENLLYKKYGTRLSIYYGNSTDIIPQLCKDNNIQAIFLNESYGQWAVTRDVIISDRCRNNHISYNSIHDFLLVPVDKIPARKVFTPFYKIREKEIEQNPKYVKTEDSSRKSFSVPIENTSTIKKLSLDEIKKTLDINESTIRPITYWEQVLYNFNYVEYEEKRNFPYINGTSKLSPYIRFWIISIREVYKSAKNRWWSVYISELAWREFRQHIYYNFHFSRETEFQEKYRNIQWDNNTFFFDARKFGKTGYPIVDAGMRQLMAENRMHNRVRMIVASFLTKDLLIDRHWWEKHFANYLLDYDKNVNIGNRQRSASVWADPKPLRIFSPLIQSKKFDPECTYIKKRLPELSYFSPKEIHNPLESDLSKYQWKSTNYPPPIVNHSEQTKITKKIYFRK